MFLSIALGTVGVTTSFFVRGSPWLGVVTGGSWLGAIIVFTTTFVPSEQVVRGGLLVAVAAAASAAAMQLWLLVPVALMLWVMTARFLGLRWTWLLAVASAGVVASAGAVMVGAPGIAEHLSLVGYALASVTCGLALLSGSDR